MPSSHLILCRPLLLLPSITPSIRVFSNESTLHMRWPKYWSFSFSIRPSKLLEKCKSKTKGGITSHLSEWLSLKSLQITNVGEDEEKRESGKLLMGIWIGRATMKIVCSFLKRTKDRNTIWFTNATAGYMSKNKSPTNLKRYMHANVHRRIIPNSQDIVLFQTLKDDVAKVLHSICQQIWKTQKWPQDWKRSVFIPIPKKGNAKECSNYHTIALFSHASKVMLKIL